MPFGDTAQCIEQTDHVIAAKIIKNLQSFLGFNLPWWDRLFGTYRAQPRAGHEAMTIGIHTFREDKWCSWLPGMLTIPFVGKVQDYAINRRQWGDDHEQ